MMLGSNVGLIQAAMETLQDFQFICSANQCLKGQKKQAGSNQTLDEIFRNNEDNETTNALDKGLRINGDLF